MKQRLVGAALMILALTARAQQVEITGFDRGGLLTWTNSVAPVFYGIETKWDLNHTWVPLPNWSSETTGPVTSVDIGNDADGFLAVMHNFSVAFDQEPPRGLFFRVVTSDTPLTLPSATNSLQIHNASTSELANVHLTLISPRGDQSVADFPSIPPGSNSPIAWLVGEMPDPDWFPTNVVQVYPPEPSHGWSMSYRQDVIYRRFATHRIVVGQPDKRISVTVSNDSLTVFNEWMGFGETHPYLSDPQY